VLALRANACRVGSGSLREAPLSRHPAMGGLIATASGTQGDVKVYRWTELCVQQIGKP
jgi:hypothetical protein